MKCSLYIHILANFYTVTVVKVGRIKSPHQVYQLSLPGGRVDTLDDLFLQPHALEIIDSTAIVMIINKAQDFEFSVALFGRSV